MADMDDPISFWQKLINSPQANIQLRERYWNQQPANPSIAKYAEEEAWLPPGSIRTQEDLHTVLRAPHTFYPADATYTLPPGAARYNRANQLVNFNPLGSKGKEGEDITAPMKEFEQSFYGKLTPETRGTPQYLKDRRQWEKDMHLLRDPSAGAEDRFNRTQERLLAAQGMNTRKEFYDHKTVEQWDTVDTQYDILKGAVQEGIASKNYLAADQSIINMYNKMMDPSSVVRESEYARTGEGQALWNRMKGTVKKIQTGGAGLTDEDRLAVLKMAKIFKQQLDNKYKERLGEYHGYLKQMGLEPKSYLNPRMPSEDITRFTVNGVEYDIPESKVKSFRQKYPKAIEVK